MSDTLVDMMRTNIESLEITLIKRTQQLANATARIAELESENQRLKEHCIECLRLILDGEGCEAEKEMRIALNIISCFRCISCGHESPYTVGFVCACGGEMTSVVTIQEAIAGGKDGE